MTECVVCGGGGTGEGRGGRKEREKHQCEIKVRETHIYWLPPPLTPTRELAPEVHVLDQELNPCPWSPHVGVLTTGPGQL